MFPSVVGQPKRSKLGIIVPLIGQMSVVFEQAGHSLWGDQYKRLLVCQQFDCMSEAKTPQRLFELQEAVAMEGARFVLALFH